MKYVFIVIILSIVAAAGGVGVRYIVEKDISVDDVKKALGFKAPVIETDQPSQAPVPKQVSQPTPKTTTVVKLAQSTVKDCGSSPDYENDLLFSNKCFEESFKVCGPAKVSGHIGVRTQTGERSVDYNYEIIGPQGGSCSVRHTYVKSNASGTEGKSMSCLFDNSKSFDDIISGNYGNWLDACSGPLKDAFNSL